MINKIKKTKTVSKYFEVAFLFLSSLTPILWLRDGEVVLGHDSGFRLNIVAYLGDLLYSWNPIQNFGADWSLFKAFMITQLPEAFFTTVTGSLTTGQTLTFIFWFFLMGLSMYIVVNSFFPDRKYWIFRIFSSLLYAYNFYILQAWFIAERGKFSLYVALPLGFLLIYKIISRKLGLLRGVVYFSLLFFLFNGGGSLPLYGGILVLYSLAFLFFGIVGYLKKGIREVFFLLKTATFLILGFLLVNSYWLLPQVYLYLESFESAVASSGGISGILAWERSINEHAGFINIFRLQGIPDWFGGEHPYSEIFLNNPLFIFASSIPILIILAGLSFSKRLTQSQNEKKIVLFMFLGILVGAIFTAGSRPPLGFIYEFLILNVPGFVIFRSSFYKFFPALIFPLAFLSGYYLNKFLINYLRNKTFIFVGLLFFAFIFAYHHPYFTGNFYAWNKPFKTKVRVPNYVEETFSYINEELPENSKILLLPGLDPEFKTDSYEWGFFSLDLLPRLGSSKPIVADDNSSLQVVEQLYDLLEEGKRDEFVSLSRALGINAYLWRGDVLYADKMRGSKNVSYLEERLVSIPEISRVYENKEWRLYGLSGQVDPLFYSAPGLTLTNDLDLSVIKTRQLLEQDRQLPITTINPNIEKISFETSLPNNRVIKAQCVFCLPQEFEDLVNGVRFHSDITPDSLVYPLVLYREEVILESYRNIPTQRVDADLSFATRRLAEAQQLLKNENLEHQYVGKITERYTNSMKDAIDQLDFMSEVDRNFYAIKISAYLEAHARMLDNLDSKHGLYGTQEWIETADFIRENMAELDDVSWKSNFPSNQKYYVGVEKEGIYKFRYLPESLDFESATLDSREIESSDEVRLDKGTHRLQINFREPDTILELAGEDEVREMNINSGTPVSYTLDVQGQQSYAAHFNYKLVRGSDVQIWLENADMDIKKKLVNDGRWHQLVIIFSPKQSLESTLKLVVLGVNKSSLIELRDSRVFTRTFPEFYLIDQGSFKETPSVEFEKINPTYYRVEVKEASDPFILAFNQSYSTGWRLYQGQENNIISSIISGEYNDRHTSLNRYSNGWVFEGNDGFTAHVFYWPQLWFYAGSIISILTIAGYLVVLTILRRRK